MVGAARKAALSPRGVEGAHTSLGRLPEAAVEAIHMIRNDPGRLTRRWFDDVLAAGLSPEAYVELVGVMNTATIIDGFARGIDEAPAPLPSVRPGEPSRETNDKVVDVGAWVPVTFLLGVVGIFGRNHIYVWIEEPIPAKALWLNAPRLFITDLAILGLLALLALAFLRASLRP